MRPTWVWIHRWVGLAMAAFLVIEGLTGAMLAFRGPLTQFFDPGLYSYASRPGAARLDLASLIESAEQHEPGSKFHWFLAMGDDLALVAMVPRKEAAAGDGEHPGLWYLALDPWTGREVRHMDGELYSRGLLSNLMPFVYELHKSLALGGVGGWILGITALLWTIDCFAGVYLTFPITRSRFWSRWKPAWQIKSGARWPRVNLDIHRAFSLWLWLVLLLFAWSSVALVDSLSVYSAVTARLFGPGPEVEALTPSAVTAPPRLDWHQALEHGKALAAAAGARDGFVVGEPNGLWYTDDRVYTLRVDTSRRFPANRDLLVAFHGDTGVPVRPWGMPDGNANSIVTDWLVGFHMITDPFQYDVYRVLIVLFGLALAAISISGVVAWYAKRRGRRARPAGGASATARR